MLKKLKGELEKAIPDPEAPMTSAQLEQLPYLTGIIQEGIRLHPGALVRQTRIAPDQTLIYREAHKQKEWVIPPGIPIGTRMNACLRLASLETNSHGVHNALIMRVILPHRNMPAFGASVSVDVRIRIRQSASFVI